MRLSSSRVRLNVGGQVFETSKPTLLAEPGSMFYALIHSGAFVPDAQTGDFFIDRDPKFFGVLLHYLRDNRRDGHLNLDMDDLSPAGKEMLRSDVEYYQLESLMNIFEEELVFVGVADWRQDGQPHREQDTLMELAANSAFPGTRPVTMREFEQNLTKGLPEAYKGPGLVFPGVDTDVEYSGCHAKKGISNPNGWARAVGPATLWSGPRIVLCVKRAAKGARANVKRVRPA